MSKFKAQPKPSDTSHSWDTPQRQSPVAILILFLKTLWRVIQSFWPVALIYFFRREEEGSSFVLLYILLGLGLLSVLIAVLKFWFYTFSITEGSLHIQSGWWKRKRLSIPLKNIQGVQLEQDVWQRLFKVSKVSFDSAGSSQVEAQMDALAIPKAEKLKEIILQQKENMLPDNDCDADTEENEKISEPALKKQAIATQTYRLDTADLLKLSLSANHLEAFFLLIALGFRIIDDLGELIGSQEEELMQSYADEALKQSIISILLGLVLLAFVSVIISAGRTLFKYYDFKLIESSQNWRVSWGLTTRQQQIIPFSKIQMISYQSNWLRRKLDFWIVSVHTVGQVKAQNQEKHSLPFTSLSKVLSITQNYLSKKTFEGKDSRNIAKVYWIRKTLLLVLPLALLLAAGAYFLIHPYMAFLGLPLLLYGAVYYHQWQQNFQWTCSQKGLWLCSGVWGRKHSLLAWHKIQQIKIQQNVYQHRKHLADVYLISAGGLVILPYQKLKIAQKLQDEILYQIESKQEKWM